VAAALSAAGRLHQPDYTFTLFGADPFPAKSLLATVAPAQAGVQALLALWRHRKLPLAGGPAAAAAGRPPGDRVRAGRGHRPGGVPCLIAYGV
jgi:Family of unknown function (DUF6529)